MNNEVFKYEINLKFHLNFFKWSEVQPDSFSARSTRT